MRSLLLAAGCAAFLLSSDLLAQTLNYERAYRFREGKVVEVVEDKNGDGYVDLVVGIHAYSAEEVRLVSGKDFRSLHVWKAPQSGTGFGSALAVHDFTGDGTVDYAVGAPAANGGSGAVYGIDGKSRQLVFQVVGGTPNSGFGTTLCFADVAPFFTDGRKELLVGAPNYSTATLQNSGQVSIYEFRAVQPTFIKSLDGTANRGLFGISMASDGDLDGNRGEDVVIGAKGYYSSIGGCGGGYFEILQGGTQNLQRTNGPARECFASDLLIGDFDNDKQMEILVGSGFNNRTAYAQIYERNASGNWVANSLTLRPASQNGRNFGLRLLRTPDLNNDQVPDFAIAGTESIELFAAVTYLSLGYWDHDGIIHDLATAGDLDKDGVWDLLVGAESGYPTFYGEIGVWTPKHWSFRPVDNYVSASQGGRVPLEIDLGPQFANHLYLLLGTASGTEPGIPLPGLNGRMPLKYDVFTGLIVQSFNAGPFVNFLGFLDSKGKATAYWTASGSLTKFAPFYAQYVALAIDPNKFVFSGFTNARHVVLMK